jgi:hypothetical protein
MKSIMSLLIVIIIFSCKQKEQEETILEEPIINETTQIPEIDKVEEVVLNKFSYEDIARYTISSVMQQPAKIIKAIKKDDLYYVSYTRKSDKQKFEYKIKFDGNKILWANIDGRWRDSEYDEKLSFSENGNILNIIQTFNDGSEDIQEYKKED